MVSEKLLGDPPLAARILAAGLMRELAVLDPLVSEIADGLFPSGPLKGHAGAELWIETWACQIASTRLTLDELVVGIQAVQADPTLVPLSWPQFYHCCRSGANHDD